MNRFQISIFLFFISFLSATKTIATNKTWSYHPGYHSDVIIMQENKPQPFSRQWLYQVAKNEGFELYDEVAKNKEFYVKMMRGHIKKLEQKLMDKKYRVSWKKLIFGLLTGVIGVMPFGVLCKELPSFYSSFDIVDVLPLIVFGATGAIFTGLSVKLISRALQYKKYAAERLERDKRILRALEQVGI